MQPNELTKLDALQAFEERVKSLERILKIHLERACIGTQEQFEERLARLENPGILHELRKIVMDETRAITAELSQNANEISLKGKLALDKINTQTMTMFKQMDTLKRPITELLQTLNRFCPYPVEPYLDNDKPSILDKPISILALPVRAMNVLVNLDIKTLGDLTVKTEIELLRQPNFGRRSLNDVKNALAGLGVHLNA